MRLLIVAADAPLVIDKSAPVQQEEDSDEIMLAHVHMEDARRMHEEGEMREEQHQEEATAAEEDEEDEVDEPSPLEVVPFPDVHDLSEDENDAVEVGADGDGDEDDNDGFILVQPQFEDVPGQELENGDAAEEEADFNSEINAEGEETGETGATGASDEGDISMSAIPDNPAIDPAAEGFKYWAGWLAQKYRYVLLFHNTAMVEKD